MYEAKVNRTGAQLYDAEHDEFSRQRLQMGEELPRGAGQGPGHRLVPAEDRRH